MPGHNVLRVLVISSALASAATAGAEIYKWVGPDGVTHYSEAAPGTPSPPIETLEFADVASPPAADYQAVLDVANDLEAGRLERERLRLERQRLREEQAQAAARDRRQYDESTRYYPVYPYYYPYGRKYPGPPGYGRHRPPVPTPYEHRHDRYAPRGGVQARVPGMSGR
jgi:hypothetical protein